MFIQTIGNIVNVNHIVCVDTETTRNGMSYIIYYLTNGETIEDTYPTKELRNEAFDTVRSKLLSIK